MLNKSNITKRIEYLDLIKGIGMLLVMWAHIMVYGYSTNFIYSFHMPLFFFASGLIFNPNKYDSFFIFVKRRIKTLIIPYMIYSVVTWLIWATYSFLLGSDVESYWRPLLQTFVAQGSGGFLVHNVPLWFVTCLFVVESLYYFISKLHKTLNVILCVGLSALGYCMIEVFNFFDFTRLPWSIEVAFATIIFYCAGHLSANKTKEFNSYVSTCGKKQIIMFCALELFISVLVLINSVYVGHISFGSDRLGNHPVLLYCDAFLGIGLIVTMCALFDAWLKGASISVNKVFEYIKWIGQNSFKFMAVHVPIKGFLMAIAAKITSTNTEYIGGNIWLSTLVFLVTLIITTYTTKITLKILQYLPMRSNSLR